MVSALQSTRLIAAQMALQILRSDDASSQSSQTLLGSSNSNLSSLPSQSQAALTNLLNSMSSSQADSSSSTSNLASTDITTTSFMTLLKQNLKATAENQGTGGQAQAMLDALDKGTLTVADPTNGVSIGAWDVDDPDEQDITGKTGDTIDTSDWNDYLKAHLKRGPNGSLVKNSDGSFVDKTTGDNVYFGQVGSQFYYLTWPAASNTAAPDETTSNSPTTATDA